nr:hypothetical protein [Verrucosispora sp. ts21]
MVQLVGAAVAALGIVATIGLMPGAEPEGRERDSADPKASVRSAR